MRALWLIPALALLAACDTEKKSRATYSCPNGPSLVLVYTEEAATIYFPDGRVEELPATEKDDLYAKPGIVWQLVSFRTARLTDGEKSFNCDQMAG